jgi:NitT/TauT family transport system ATP-binding protein
MATFANASSPLLEVSGVTLRYKTDRSHVTATFRVSFEVFAGNRYVLLGPSGCGKSNLLKAIGGCRKYSGSLRSSCRRCGYPGS